MDRKFCVLLYSNHSKASLDVLNYIRNLSKMYAIDFPTITGMTMICIDNPEFKLILHNNGITYVPTLLVEYYNGSKQKFERDYIYEWIDQIITRNLPPSIATSKVPYWRDEPLQTHAQEQKPISSATPSGSGPQGLTLVEQSTSKNHSNRTLINSLQNNGPVSDPKVQGSDASGSREVQTSDVTKNKKPDIAAIALEMQKNRDLELAEIKEYQKPI